MTQDDAWRELLRLSFGPIDPRSDRGKRHKLPEVLFIVVTGLICGCQNASDLARFAQDRLVWLRQFLVLEHGVPSHDTFLEVLAVVKTDEVRKLVADWVAALREPGSLSAQGGHVAIDGQVLRGSINRGTGQSGIDLVSAYLTDLGITLGTTRVDDKSNEIRAIPDLIAGLNLRGATVTIDAIGCQRSIAAQLQDAGADYVLQVKENQPHLLADLERATAEVMRRRRPGEAPADIERCREVDKGHGRIETRACIISHDLSEIQGRGDWKGLAGFAAVARERVDVLSGKTSKETAYFILSNVQATVEEVATIIRKHWTIENGLHWSLDVVWGSDGHKVRNRAAAENLANLRRFCAGMVKQAVGWGETARGVRVRCGFCPDLILDVLSGKTIGRVRTRRPNRKDVGRYGMGLAKEKKD